MRERERERERKRERARGRESRRSGRDAEIEEEAGNRHRCMSRDKIEIQGQIEKQRQIP